MQQLTEKELNVLNYLIDEKIDEIDKLIKELNKDYKAELNEEKNILIKIKEKLIK